MALLRKEYQERHHHRKRIIEEKLLQYRERVLVSERNKTIVEQYAQGKSYGEIAKKNGITTSRVEQIVHGYIRHCVMLKKGEGPYLLN